MLQLLTRTALLRHRAPRLRGERATSDELPGCLWLGCEAFGGLRVAADAEDNLR